MKQLNVRLTQDRNKKPLAVVENFPGLDAEMTPAQLRSLAKALMNAADVCEESNVKGLNTFTW
ncbi:hypothetical protein [Methylomonas sp. HYX-M1]|uniref:hypothetical protein n=1 Tax=Methylomonas sp. HYX-M1 TaxID=3139307 RepID=UPI00345BF782